MLVSCLFSVVFNTSMTYAFTVSHWARPFETFQLMTDNVFVFAMLG